MNVQMNLLSKSFVTYLALKGSFSCVYTHMHNQITLLSKPFLAIRALMRSSTGMSKKVSLQTTFLRERFHTHRTGELINLDVKGTYTEIEFGEWVWWKWVILKKRTIMSIESRLVGKMLQTHGAYVITSFRFFHDIHTLQGLAQTGIIDSS